MAREAVTLSVKMSATITTLSQKWGVDRAEAFRRLWGLGSWAAKEILKGNEVCSVTPGSGEVKYIKANKS